MKYTISSVAVVGLALFILQTARSQNEITLVAPGGMKCALDRMTPYFEGKIGRPVKVTIGSGGATRQQVAHGAPFDVPIVEPPYQDVLASGYVVASSETPLAAIPVVVTVRKGDLKPDISTPEAVKGMLVAAKTISYPDGAGGKGGGAGVSFDKTLKKLGMFDEIQSKVKRVQGLSVMQLLTNGDIDVGVVFASEINDPRVEVVGPLPKEISTPTEFVGFVSSHATSAEAAKALLSYLSSPQTAEVYKACSMESAH